MSFSFSEAQDAEYALGWPHVRRASEKKEKPERALADAQKLLGAVDPVFLPEATAARMHAYVQGHDVTPRATPAEAIERMKARPALGVDDVDALMRAWRKGSRYWFQVEELVLDLEALLGSDAAGGALVAHYAQHGFGEMRALSTFFGNAMTDVSQAGLFCLGFVALRSPSTRAALVALRDDAKGHARATLDLVLDGAEGCRRHGLRHLFGASFAGDDPSYLASFAQTEIFHSSLTPRLCYLGGEPLVMQYEARLSRGVPPYLAARTLAWFGTIRHPRIVALMGLWATKSKTQKAALAWLRQHAPYVREHLEVLPESVRRELEA